jgi:hypothetical protein
MDTRMEISRRLIAMSVAVSLASWRQVALHSSLVAVEAAHPSVLTPDAPAFQLWVILYLFLIGGVIRESLSPTKTDLPTPQLKTW